MCVTFAARLFSSPISVLAGSSSKHYPRGWLDLASPFNGYWSSGLLLISTFMNEHPLVRIYICPASVDSLLHIPSSPPFVFRIHFRVSCSFQQCCDYFSSLLLSLRPTLIQAFVYPWISVFFIFYFLPQLQVHLFLFI